MIRNMVGEAYVSKEVYLHKYKSVLLKSAPTVPYLLLLALFDEQGVRIVAEFDAQA